MLGFKLIAIFLGIAAAGLIACIGLAASVSSNAAWAIGISGAVVLILSTVLLSSSRAKDGDLAFAVLAAIAGVVLRYPVDWLLLRFNARALDRSAIEAGMVLAPPALLGLWMLLRPAAGEIIEQPLTPETPLATLQAEAAAGNVKVLEFALAASARFDDAFSIIQQLGSVALPGMLSALSLTPAGPSRERLIALLGAVGRVDQAYSIAAGYAAPEVSPGARAAALRALASIDPARARPLAESAVRDSDAAVQEAARTLLARSNSSRA